MLFNVEYIHKILTMIFYHRVVNYNILNNQRKKVFIKLFRKSNKNLNRSKIKRLDFNTL
jgi:hypothetical protein